MSHKPLVHFYLILQNKRIIHPCQQVGGRVRLSGSKYLANRYLPIAALASSESHFTNLVDNEDIQAALQGLSALGYQLAQSNGAVRIRPRLQACQNPVEIYTHHSGTFSRFVTAIAALESVPVTIDCSGKMATRPMKELFDALRALGVTVNSDNDCLPATILGPITTNECEIDAGRSSQFVSALLIAGAARPEGIKIRLKGKLVSNAYLEMTIRILQEMGVTVVREGNLLTVAEKPQLAGISKEVSCDAVSSTYFMGAVAIAGGELIIEQFDFDSVQGEAAFYQVIEKMGVSTERRGADLWLQSNGQLNAIDVDMAEMPDAVQTLAAIACYAQGTTVIRNIAHLAYKESDRIRDTANEIARTGIRVEAGKDYLKIEGGRPAAAQIQTHDDHRMAMSLSLLGIRCRGIEILNPEVVAKSFPDFWDKMAGIGLNSTLVACEA